MTPVQNVHSIALRKSKNQRLNIGDRVHNHGLENTDMLMLVVLSVFLLLSIKSLSFSLSICLLF